MCLFNKCFLMLYCHIWLNLWFYLKCFLLHVSFSSCFFLSPLASCYLSRCARVTFRWAVRNVFCRRNHDIKYHNKYHADNAKVMGLIPRSTQTHWMYIHWMHRKCPIVLKCYTTFLQLEWSKYGSRRRTWWTRVLRRQEVLEWTS